MNPAQPKLRYYRLFCTTGIVGIVAFCARSITGVDCYCITTVKGVTDSLNTGILILNHINASTVHPTSKSKNSKGLIPRTIPP